MKLASYRTQAGPNYGVVVDGGVVALKGRLGGRFPTLRDLLAANVLEEAGAAIAGAAPDVQLSDLVFLPVIPSPDKFLAIGINYRDHAQETGRTVELKPSSFVRFDDTLIGHRQPMVRPRVSHQFDFEGELAVIIGKLGRYIPKSAAMDHVAGYSIFVDGSVRDYQKHAVTAGKNFPSTGPFGPWMVTADEIRDPSKLTLTTRLNGTVMQHSGLDMLIHSVPALIAYLSEYTSLGPGDVIATGTPAGVGHRRNPKLWMKPGDRLEVEISGIGTLENSVVDEA